ncbi:hypothetical protein NFS79_004570 [Salmonella enterica]|nr:hypothetical protein [Salmonella enterica]ECI0123255.1 hypothetical protein [Salmonella enterica subsp. enterica serovar Abaetetuba]EDW0292872.1 hypothetical protein [Salmonella enterica subsp. enterica serovar Poona]EIR0330872.1 hypothetical protein [Salmonella enterica subsp. enterica serovar Give]EAT6024878.1 hypothetical protein [Salmonella enterica]
MLVFVREALYQPPGQRHEYRLSDGCVAVEFPALPVPSRWKFYDNGGHRIVKKSTQATMKAAVERHKRRFNCK